ncbi:MAG: ABC transporter substrate-binding protein [Paludibacteraceae bacterium]|nr:ABC transporter substrate-binding protein [Paludibacteraceae bacterium]
MKKIFYLLLPLLICSCNRASQISQSTATPFDTLNLKYSEEFNIYYYDNYKLIEIYNPWVKNQIQQRLYLVSDNTIKTPTDGIKILIPIDNVAISSSTHVEFLNLLGELSTVKGVCTPHLIYNDTLRSRYAAGQIQSLGDAHNVNLEQLMHLRPDVYFAASYNQQDEQAKRLQQSGVNLVFNNEWTESSLLARAEWLKFVAAFFNKEQLADSLFAQIERDYLAASAIAQSVDARPTVVAGGNFKGTWYMPSGFSYMARLFADAGADYFYKDETSTAASLALNFETVLSNFHDADIWLNAPTTTLDALYQMDSRHNLFRSAREGRVYAFYRRTLPDGANDFWESAVARPDLVLKDLIWALHPNLLPDYTPTYIIQLN